MGKIPGQRGGFLGNWIYRINQDFRLGNDPETLEHERRIVWIQPEYQDHPYVEQYLTPSYARSGSISAGNGYTLIAYAELGGLVEPNAYSRFIRRTWKVKRSRHPPPGALVDPRSIYPGRPSIPVDINGNTLVSHATDRQGVRATPSHKGNSMNSIPNKTVRRILVAQAGKCAVCGTALDEDDYEVYFQGDIRRAIVCSPCSACLNKWCEIRASIECDDDPERLALALQQMYRWEQNDE
jgi:hypothetical protein